MEEKDTQKIDHGVIALRNLISIGIPKDTVVLQKSHSLYYFHCLSDSVNILDIILLFNAYTTKGRFWSL